MNVCGRRIRYISCDSYCGKDHEFQLWMWPQKPCKPGNVWLHVGGQRHGYYLGKGNKYYERFRKLLKPGELYSLDRKKVVSTRGK